VVPAILVQVQAQVQDTFPATGQRVEETAATGTVRFQNFDPTTKNTIAKGAVVSTSAGVRFATDRAITIPPAELVFGERTIVVPASADVGVTAADPGVAGNVEANTITTIPRGEEPLFLKVSNPDPTTGGTRTEFPRVRQADVDEAVAALTAGVGEAFTQRLDDPALSADGSTVFPQTAVAGEPAFDQDLEALVGQEVETFDLGATVTGSVTAVDAAPVQVIAEARLGSSVDAGYELVDGSSVITIDPAVVNDGTIAFPVIVTARQVRILDPAAIEAEIRGLSLVAAREVLDRYGTAELVVWPDWVATIPTLDGRVQVTIDGPVVVEAPTDGGVAP
ncbi:MAG: baseplate J/gp47 family protein, partial [Chloroflexota bacterium]